MHFLFIFLIFSHENFAPLAFMLTFNFRKFSTDYLNFLLLESVLPLMTQTMLLWSDTDNLIYHIYICQ